MLIGYLFDNRLLRFKEDSTFLLLCTNAVICEDFLLPKNIRPKISALTVRPRNQKFELSPLFSLLSGQFSPFFRLKSRWKSQNHTWMWKINPKFSPLKISNEIDRKFPNHVLTSTSWNFLEVKSRWCGCKWSTTPITAMCCRQCLPLSVI